MERFGNFDDSIPLSDGLPEAELCSDANRMIDEIYSAAADHSLVQLDRYQRILRRQGLPPLLAPPTTRHPQQGQQF